MLFRTFRKPIATGSRPRITYTPVTSLWCRECIDRRYRFSLRLVVLLLLGTLPGTGLSQLSPAQAETRFTPSVRLSERYDSNVWFGPKSSVPVGKQAWDLVTTAGTQALIENKSRLGETIINAGVNASAFAYNTDLAFVSTNVFAASDLSDWTKELLPGLKFRISDAFLYTPETPAFLAGGTTAGTSDVFSRGIQAVRANTYSNIFRARGDYSLSRAVALRTDYEFSIRRVGQLQARAPAELSAVFFNNTVHTLSAGPTYRLEAGDTLFMKYSYQTADSAPASGEGSTISYSAHTIEPEYVSVPFRGWTLTMSGGATLVEEAGNRTFFSGRLVLATNLDRALRAQVSASRQIKPAFFGTPGALISNVAQVYISQRFSKVLQLTVSGNYAYNESTPVDSFKFESRTASVVLEYKMTRNYIVSLSQEYNRFEYTGVEPFDRYATMLTLTAEWK